jgi:uncharacterized protein YndB with AHSA1/START domain
MFSRRTAHRDALDVSTPSDREIRLTRVFDAPRDLVFEAMTKPEHVARWWGQLGDGYSVPVCEIDLRPGGAWRFVNRHPQGDVTFFGEYAEIAAPSRLVFTEVFEEFPDSVTVVTAVYTEEGTKTRMTATVQYDSQEVRDMVLESGMTEGAAVSYDRLEDVVAELCRAH